MSRHTTLRSRTQEKKSSVQGSTHSSNNNPPNYIVVRYGIDLTSGLRSGKVVDGIGIMTTINMDHTMLDGEANDQNSRSTYSFRIPHLKNWNIAVGESYIPKGINIVNFQLMTEPVIHNRVFDMSA